MSVNITFDGQPYIIAETGEVGWGGNTTSYLVAIAAGCLQKTGGSFTLSAETDFGASFGLKSLSYKSRTALPANSGIIRLANNSDSVSWRNTADSADLPLAVNGSDQLTFDGVPVAVSGGGTVNPGILGRLAIYSATGTTVDDQATIGSGAIDIIVASLAANRSYTIPDSGADSSFVMTDGVQTINGAKTLSSVLTLPIGAAATPSLRFTGFLTTGLSARATNILTASANGIAQQEWFDSFSLFVGTHVRFPVGSAADPSITITGDLTKGIYSPGSDRFAFATNGLFRGEFVNAGLRLQDGSAAVPSLSFAGFTTTGLSARGTNILTASANGISQQEWFDSFSAFQGTHVRFPLGTEAAPGIVYNGRTDDGWQSIGASNIGLSLGGNRMVDYGISTITFTPPLTVAGGIIDLLSYRRPNLIYGSATTISVEAGLNGTSGDVRIMFPDGTVRITNNTTLTTFDITRNAVLSGSKQSGLRTGSEATDTWYAIYAVKATDSSDIVTVGDTVLPIQANFATLNSNFGTDDWIYLGLIRNGDSSATTGDILTFVQTNGITTFRNNATGSAENGAGILLADTASATSLTYTYVAGTGDLQIPGHLTTVAFQFSTAIGATATDTILRDSASARPYYLREDLEGNITDVLPFTRAASGLNMGLGSAKASSIYLRSFIDPLLSSGTNPLL